MRLLHLSHMVLLAILALFIFLQADEVQVQEPKQEALEAKPPMAFALRVAKDRDKILRQFGGTVESEAAVTRGLHWLAANQASDGHWPGCEGYDIAGTAFGLLPFLGAGHTHMPSPRGVFDQNVAKGLAYLVEKQNSKGDFGNGMYAQGLATLALCEAHALTKDDKLRRPAQRALDYVVWAQDDNGGGWRYGPKQAGDTSVTGWQVQALMAGRFAGLNIPEKTLQRAREYLDNCCSDNDGYGYVGKGGRPTMSAVGLLCRQQLQGWGPNHVRLSQGVKNHIIEHTPGRKNVYYTYYAMQVMRNLGGQAWKEWNKKNRNDLIAAQDTNNGAEHGSWSTDGAGHVHGRVMMTSLCLLSLEVYYRYQPEAYQHKRTRSPNMEPFEERQE